MAVNKKLMASFPSGKHRDRRKAPGAFFFAPLRGRQGLVRRPTRIFGLGAMPKPGAGMFSPGQAALRVAVAPEKQAASAYEYSNTVDSAGCCS